jgi:hypothetical protein
MGESSRVSIRLPGYPLGYNPDLMTFTRAFNYRWQSVRDFMTRPMADKIRGSAIGRTMRRRGAA